MLATFIVREENEIYYAWGLEYKVQNKNTTKVFSQLVYIILPENLNRLGDWLGSNNKVQRWKWYIPLATWSWSVSKIMSLQISPQVSKHLNNNSNMYGNIIYPTIHNMP